jgi:hypothetical protein
MPRPDRPYSPHQATAKPRPLDQVRGVLRRKHYSIRTEQSYVDGIKRFVLFNAERHPAQMGKVEVRAFLTCLAAQRYVAASTRVIKGSVAFTAGSVANAASAMSTPRL